MYAYRPGMLVDETANATIAPELTSSNRDTPVDINDFHVAHAHVHKGALRMTAMQMSVTLKESCMNARATRWQRGSACPSYPRRTAAVIRNCLACLRI